MSETDTHSVEAGEEPDADAGESDDDDTVGLEDFKLDDAADADADEPGDDTAELEDFSPDEEPDADAGEPDEIDEIDGADEADDAAGVDADESDDDTVGLEDFLPDEEPDANAGESDEIDEADDAKPAEPVEPAEPAEADDVADAEPAEPVEPIETEVVGNAPDGMVRERPDTLRQFAAEAGPLTFRLIPEFANSGFRWVLTMYADGVRGSIIETSQGIPADLAADYGLAETMRQELNSKLEHANENLEPPRMMRGQGRETKKISELGSD
jgi:hypothetical protein